MPRFVLDHNFPYAATGIKWPPDLTLTRLSEYDRRLIRDHADWQVLTEIVRRGDADGFITNDGRMLNLAPEMVALSLSRLVLIVTDETGDDPLVATGLLMTHLVEVTIRERENRGPRLYRLRRLDLGHQSEPIQVVLRRLADRKYIHVDRMISEERRRIEAWPGLPPAR